MGNLLGTSALQRVATDLSGLKGFFAVMAFVFLLYSQMGIEFRCSCANKAANLGYCWTIMILPAILILFLVLGINKRFQRSLNFTSRYCCNKKHHCQLIATLMDLLNRACFAALVWVVVMLIHGDWYVCCSYSLPEEQSHLPCKDKHKRSDEERDVVYQLKNRSMGIGLMLLTSVVLLVFIMNAVSQCCRTMCPASCGPMDSYRNIFVDSLLDETHNQILMSLKTSADKYVTAKLITDPKMKALQWTAGDQGDGETGPADVENQVETLDQVIARVGSLEWTAISNFAYEIIDS